MKKMITIALAAAMAMSMAVSAFAGAMVPAAQEADEIQPHAGQGMDCGRGEMSHIRTVKDDWCFVAYVGCQNGATDHRDKIYERGIINAYRCTHCGIEEVHTYTEEKIDGPYF